MHNPTRHLPALAILLLAACSEPPPAAPPETKPAVAVVTVRQEAVPLRAELPGRVTALRVSEVRPQVGGVIVRRHFEEGSDVKAGTLLYEIGSDSYAARQEQAAAELAIEQAALVNLRIIAERYRRLIESKTVTQQDHDLAQANYEQGLARVKARQAALRTAQIDLARTQIRAPIAGRIGRAAVTEGALVASEQVEPLARIQQVDPILVDVVQSSGQLTQLKRRLGSGALQPGKAAVTLLLEDGQPYPHAGVLKFTEMNVDGATGSVTLRASFPNPDGLLMPGMYVRARVEQGVQPDAVRLPQQAVRHNERNEATALVVGRDGKVEQRVLDLIGSEAGLWAARAGLKAGEKVIVEGGNKVAPGTVVSATEWQGRPAAARAATPAEG
ncbi:efflux RND transporter periplasmic adaptor subunit [Pseudoduganella chitinolytica]|uniref:Efflux RND transporter periplasmic adaptor subunit n=1 Tax=Pseudoduganella chitinolytica TaxID=34070 RepID=A0ABY8BGB0_9BURK|nr:efflux RND transporter periplasmic adaptor subunit [Pseudoduganella chitinolytica]WEF34966.1 efflux RND transporter periplasmic adaptor subunit [Pseudoduganella chitinolytica]